MAHSQKVDEFFSVLRKVFESTSCTRLSTAVRALNLPPATIKSALDHGISQGLVKQGGDQFILVRPLPPSEIVSGYFDHDGTLLAILRLWESNGPVPTLIIGPAGCGKTQMVISLAEKLRASSLINGIVTLNGCEDTKSRDLVGMLRVDISGALGFFPGAVAQAMMEGKLFYFDEANAVPPGVLVKLDQAMDDRKELTIPLSSDQFHVIKAASGFSVIATVNPLSMVGTRTMPAQMMSRFGYVFEMRYPADPAAELELVVRNTSTREHTDDLLPCISAIQALRKETTFPYYPTVRESISCHRALISGFSPADALDMSVLNRGAHWSRAVVTSMRDITNLYVR